MRKSELSSAIKTARDIKRKDAGLSTDVDRIPQLVWILFLKCFDDLEQRGRPERAGWRWGCAEAGPRPRMEVRPGGGRGDRAPTRVAG